MRVLNCFGEDVACHASQPNRVRKHSQEHAVADPPTTEYPQLRLSALHRRRDTLDDQKVDEKCAAGIMEPPHAGSSVTNLETMHTRP